MKAKDTIQLTKEQKTCAVQLIQDYMSENFSCEISGLQTGILLDFLSETIGVYYYNQGISDASAYIQEKAEDMFLIMKDEKTF